VDWTWFVTGHFLLRSWEHYQHRRDARPMAVTSDPAHSFPRGGNGILGDIKDADFVLEAIHID
jgi:hypothetical protein